MTYDTSYSFVGTGRTDDIYGTENPGEYSAPRINEIGRVKLKKRPAKTSEQEERDRRLAWLRNLREE